jgi:hypothetical protein
MKKLTISLSSILLVGIVGLYLAGCATGPTATAPAKTMPQMVQEAGFRGFPAGTDQEMAHLQVCPRDTLMIHEGKTARCYAFADPASKTMYIGDEAAYGLRVFDRVAANQGRNRRRWVLANVGAVGAVDFSILGCTTVAELALLVLGRKADLHEADWPGMLPASEPYMMAETIAPN